MHDLPSLAGATIALPQPSCCGKAKIDTAFFLANVASLKCSSDGVA